MTPLDQGAAASAAGRVQPVPAPLGRAACPECGASAPRRAANQLFCTPAHRDAWNTRIAVRGKVAQPLAMVARITRDGTRGSQVERDTGRRAASELRYLLQKWRDEDRAAGRMDWPTYLALRYASGFDPLT